KHIAKGRKNISDLGLQKSSAKLLPKDTILFSSRAPIGYVAIAINEISTNQGFKNILPSPFFVSAYVYYFLKFKRGYIESQASGTTFKEISLSKMQQIPLLLPPLPEQERIVAKLDKLFTQHEKIKKA